MEKQGYQANKKSPGIFRPRVLLTLLLAIISLHAVTGQSYLIPVDAPSNKYPITFTDEAQQTLIIEFDRAVTAGGTSAGWTITVGGVPVAMTGNPAPTGNFLRIVLSTPIPYASRNSVLVSYNPAAGNMSLTGGVEPNFTNIQAVNNYIATSADFSNGLYGEIAPVDICAPVVDVQVESNIVMSRRYRNSIHYSLPKVWILWEYPNAFPRTLGFYTEVGAAGSGIFRAFEPYAGYPDNTLNCTWDVSIYPYLYNTGTLQPNLYITVNQIVIQLPNYKRDNGTPAPGTGQLGIELPVDDPGTLFCVGDDITAFVFEDATAFDCQLPVEPDLPNIYSRHVQWVYGTHTTAGIPNVFIDVNGTMVQVTDNNGDPISGTWHVNPDGTPNPGGYTTPSGFFEGPVIQYDWDFFTRLLVTPMAETYPIYHTGDFINDQAGDIFDVTLRNWGPCNPWDGGNPFTHLDAVTEFSRLRLIESPPLPTAPDVYICFGGSTTLTAVRNGAPNPGLLHWYDDAALTNEVGTGNTYTPGVSAVGTYTYYVREISGNTGNCPGPAEDVVLTINPIPNTPTITRTGADFCYDGIQSVTLTANPNSPPAISSYQWYRNGAAIAGATTNTIVLDDIAESGNYTVRTYGVAPTNCPSPISAAVTVTIGLPATVNAGTDQDVCTSSNSITVTGTRGGSATSSTWSTSGTGTFASASSLTTTYTFSVADKSAASLTLTLTTNNPTGPCPAVSDAMVVTLYPAATVSAGADQSICSSTPTVSLTGSIGGGASWANWTSSGSGSFANASNPVTTYTPSAGDITAGTVTLTLTTNNPAGPCSARSDAMVLTISPVPVVNAGIDQDICAGSVVSVSGTRSGGASTSTWSSSGTGSFANASALATTYNPSAADIAAGTVTLTLTTNDPAGPCTSVSDAMVVTIYPAPTVNAGPDQSICALATATLAGTIGGSASSASWSGGSGTFAPNSNTLNAVYTPSLAERTAGTATLTLTTNNPAGPCGAVSDNMIITIGSSPTGATIQGSGDVCDGGSAWFRVNISGGAWPYILNYTLNGTPYTINGYTSGTNINLGTPAVGTYTIVVTSITDNCTTPVPGLPKSYIINVNAIPTLSSSLTPPAICSGSAFSYTPTSATVGTTFTWSRATVAGITPVGPTSGSNNPNETLTNTTAAPISVVYAFTLTANGCTNNQNVTVVVNPRPTLSSSLTPPAICSGTAFSYTPTSATVGTTFTWDRATVAGITPAGPTSGNNNPNETLTNTTAAPITVTYRYTLTANGCTNIQNVTVVVNPSPTLSSSLTPPAICSGTAFSYTPTSATVGTTFTWNRATVAGITPAGPTSGNNNPNETLTNTTAAPITVTYRYTLTANGCTNIQNVTVVVNPRPTLSSSLTPPAICSGTAFSYTPTSATVGTTFTWNRATVAGITPAGPTSGSNNPNETLTNTTAAPISVVYAFTLTANGCTNTQNVTVVVNPRPTLTSSLTPPAICSGSTFSYTPTSGTVGTVFTWNRATVAGITPAGPTSGSNNPNETLTNTTAAPISVVYAFTLTANGCSNTQNVTVVVNPRPTLTSSLTPPAICSGSTFSYTPTSGTVGTVFTWSRATVAGITPAGPTSGNNNPNETLTNTTAAPITVTYVYTLTANGCTNNQNVTVVVNPRPTLSSSLTPPAICSGTAFSYTPTSATVGTTFTWSRATVAGITPAGPTSGSNNPNETLVNTTTAPIPVVYAYTLTANGCTNTQNVTVVVNPGPVLSSSLTPPAICSGNVFNYTPTSATVGTTFNWTRANVAGILPAGPTSGTNNPMEFLTNTTASPITVTYAYTISALGCTIVQNVTLVVNPGPVLTTSLTPPAICSGTAFSYTPTSATAGTTFNWTRANVVGITPAGPITGTDNPNETLTNLTSVPLTVTYTYALNAAGCTSSQDVTVVVNPTPVLSSTLTPLPICSNTSFSYTPTSATTGTSFTWQRAPVAGILPAGPTTGAGNPNETLVNTTTNPVTVTYVYTLIANGCTSTQNVVVAVNPQPAEPVISGRDKLCTGETGIVYSVPLTPGSEYTWTVPASVGTKVLDFNSNAIIINAAIVAGSGTISVAETNSLGCIGAAGTFDVTVMAPSPVATVAGDNSICALEAAVYSLPDNPGSTYFWSVPTGAAIIGNPSLASVTVTFGTVSGDVFARETNAAGCITNHLPLAVTVLPLPSALISNSGTICAEGTHPVNITLTGSAPWTVVYAINGAAQPALNIAASPYTLNANLAGNYTITSVTDANGCTNTGIGNATVTYFPVPTATISGTTEMCSGGSAVITITLTGAMPYDFIYTDGTTPVVVTNHAAMVYTFTVSPLAPVTYTVTSMNDNNGCVGTPMGAAVITINPSMTLTLTGTNLTCYGDNSGSVDLAVADGTAPFSYSWSGPGGFTAGTEDISGLQAGYYAVIVTDSKGCTATGNVILSQPDILTLSSTGDILLLCNGVPTGAGSFTAAGGTAPYAFTTVVNTAGATLTSAASSVAVTDAGGGTITVRVTDANSCTAESTIIVTEPPALNLSSVVTNVSCFGGTNGTIITSVTGGTAPYIYAWSASGGGSGITAGAPNQGGLTAGTYDLTVTDANGCDITGTWTITQPTVLAVTAAANDNLIGTCSSAQLTATVTGGVEPAGGYLYSWSPAAGLTAANISNPVATPASTTTYTVTVTDANGCIKTASVTVDVAPVLTAVAFADDNLIGACPTSETQLHVNLNGGEAPYSFSWMPVAGLSSAVIREPMAKPAATQAYTVTVTDANGCTATASVTVSVAPDLDVTATVDDNLIGTCPTSVAHLSATATGGEGAYTYLWDNAGTLNSATSATPTAKPLATTTYTVTVTDANGCTDQATVIVNVAPPLAVTASADDLFIGTCPTSVSHLDATVTGGEAGYTYKWTPLTGLDDSNIKTPTAKPSVNTTYTVTVTDANGCTATSSILISIQPALTLTLAVDDSSIGTCPGSEAQLTSTAGGGEPGYIYLWTPAAGLSSDTNPNPTAKPAATTTYTLTVTDQNGCSISRDITVNVVPALTVTASAADPLIGTCPTSNTALNAVALGGEPGYTYSWSPVAGLNNPLIQSPLAKPAVTTTYTVTVTDNNGCQATADVLVTVAPDLTAVATVDDGTIGTCPTSVAHLDVTASGGEPGYTYLWAPVAGLSDPNSKTPSAKPSATTTYIVTVTDANGCQTTASVVVNVAPVLNVAVTADDYNIGTCPTSDAQLTASASGGEPGYTYLWSPATGLSDATIFNPLAKPLVTTSYTVLVTDVNGCTSTASLTITVAPDLAATATASDPNIGTCPGSQSTLDVIITGGEPGYTYLWAPATGLSDVNSKTPTAKPAVTTTYTVTVTDNNGCQTTAPVTVTVLPDLVATATADDLIIGTCPTSRSNLGVTVTGGEAGFTYSWAPATGLNNPNVSNPIAKPLITTTYTVTVTDANGCQATDDITITVAPVLTVAATADDDILSTCPTSVAQITAAANGGEELATGGYIWSWAPSTGLSATNIPNPIAKPASTTTYTVTVTDANGCSAVNTITIEVRPPLAAIATATDYLIGDCPGSTTTLDVAVTGGELPYAYSWVPAASLSDPNIKNPVAKPLANTTYTVTVTDANNCTVTATVAINIAPPLTATAAVDDDPIGACPTSVARLSTTVSGGEGGYTYLWNNAGTLDDATKANPTAKPATSTLYTVTVTDSNGCQTTATVQVNVAPDLTVTATADDNIIGACPSSVATLMATGAGGELLLSGDYTYNWSPAAGLNYTNVKSPVAKPAVTTTYTVTITDRNGCTASDQVTITVMPPIALTTTPVVYAGGYNITCNGASDGAIDLEVTGGEPLFAYAWSGPAGFTATSQDISGRVAGTYTVIVTDANNCTSTTTVVLLEPAVLTLGRTPDVVLSCFGDATATGSFSVSGGTAPYVITATTNTSGATVNITGTSLSFTGGAVGQITAQVVDANSCTTSATITITQPPQLLPGSIDGDQEVCYLGNPTPLNEVTVPAGGPATILFQWERSLDGGGSWSDVSGATTASYDPPAGILQTTHFRRRVNSAACDPAYSNPVIVTVNPLPVASIAGTGFVCPGDAATVTLTITTGESPFIVVLSDGTTVPNYISGSPITVNPFVTTTYTITSVTDNNGCTVAAPHADLTGSATIDVKTVPEVVVQPLNVTVCEDGTATFITDAGGTTNPSYRWFVDTGSGMTVIPGETAATLSFTAVSAMNGNKYQAEISGDCPVTVLSDIVTLTVNEKPEITAPPADVTLCSGEDAIFTVDAGVTTNPMYQWYVNTGTGWNPATGARYQGANTATLTVVSALEIMSGYQYRVRISGTCAPYVESAPVTLTVTRQAEITQHPVSLTLCEGAAATFTVNAGLSTNPGFQWERSLDGGATWTAITGATTATYNIAAVATADNNTAYRAIVSSSCGTSITSLPAFLTVNELPEITDQPDDVVICEYAIADFVVNAGVTTGATYEWQRSINGGTSWTKLTETATYFGVSTPNLKVNGTNRMMNGDMFQVIITGICMPPVTSTAALLTVNTAPEILAQPVASTICENTNTSFTVSAQGTAPAYQWFVDTGDGLGFNAIINGGVYSGATSNTLTLTNVPRTYDNYRYRVEVEGTCLPKAISQTVQLDVSIEKIITQQPADSAICEFMTASFTALADGANLGYQWQTFTGGAWTDLTNSGIYMGVKTPTLMVFGPSRTMDGTRYRAVISGDCSADLISGEALLTVYTAPELSDHPDEFRGCPTGSATFSVAATGTVLVYQWQVNSGTGFVNVTDVAPYSGTTTNTLTISNLDLSMNGYLVRAVVSGTCLPPVISSFAPLRVYMEPSIISQPADAEVCDLAGAIFYSQVFNTGAGETTVWQVNQGAGWSNLADGPLYQGTQTPQLVIMSAATAMNGWLYRLEITGPCGLYYTREALLTVNAWPTAQIAPVDTLLVCGGVATQLHGNPAGGSLTYTAHRWFGDIGPLNQYNIENPVFNTSMAGYYRLIYQVTDSKGCVGLDTLVIEVEKPVAMFTADVPSGCQPLTVQFTNGSTGYASLLWDFGDATTSTDVNPTHTYTNAGPALDYRTVKLEITSANGCVSSMENNITIYPEILSDFVISDDTICSGESIMFSLLPGAFRYYWNYGDGFQETGSNIISHVYFNTTTAPVTYNVTLRTESFFGCLSETTIPVVVYPTPLPAFIATPPLQVFPASTVTFTNNTNAGAWTWLWNFDDGTTSVDMSPVHTYAAPGDFDVSLTVSNGICTEEVVHMVRVLPTPPIADFDTIPSGCQPLNVAINNTSLYGTNYYWDFGDGHTSNAKDPNYTYVQSGTFQITLTVTGPGGSDTESQIVHVYPTPRAYFDASPAKVYVNDEEVRLFNLSEGADSFIWEFGDGDTSHVRDPYHKYTTEGIYDITLHAYSANGCYDTYVMSPAVTVEPFGDLVFASVFKPNTEGPIEIDELPNSGEAMDMFFFPPIRETVLEYHMQIFNRWGTLIFETFDINRPWNGYYKGKLCQQGVYVWLVEGKYANGRPFKKAGDITLLH